MGAEALRRQLLAKRRFSLTCDRSGRQGIRQHLIMMNDRHLNNRRGFLRRSASISLGLMVAGPSILSGETTEESILQDIDLELATTLESYGRAASIHDHGYQKVRQGGRVLQLPVSRVTIDVQDRDSFCQSFEKLTRLSDHVLVDGNTTRFARDGRFFIIENRVA